MMLMRSLALGLTLAFLAGCSVMQSQMQSEPVDLDSKFAVIPLGNLSQTPQAGDQAASILSALLRARGAAEVELYLPTDDNPLIYDNHDRQQDAIATARDEGADIIVEGTVDEWRYKSGLDGEPAIGITLVFRNADDNSVIWSATGARTGWGREGVAVAGHKVLEKLLDEMPVIEVAR
ncbi:hypothetical protein ACNQ6O_12805 [Marinobacter sp. SBS5]|uniref:hypothetical protein n=1 Tax=Marinobacter sp. SBS5 TaxID=3401754 RepID=UPI003AAB96FC